MPVFSDARAVADGATLEADLCVLGSGVAGISIAREFIGRPQRVLLLEGGSLSFTKSLRELPTVLKRHTVGEQELARGANVGHAYYPLRFTRVRAFGGSSRAWHEGRGVHAHPLDAIDFEPREGFPDHGWPINRAELDPFYERAQGVCGLGPFAYDATTWSAEGYGEPLPLDPTMVRSEVFQFGQNSKFDRFEDVFAEADNVEVVLHANGVHLADTGGRLDRVECATLSGNRFNVRAKTFVIATGAIETARLLLVSTDSQPDGIGNAHGLVGRYFMEHPDAAVGYLIPDSHLDASDFRLYEHQSISEHQMVEAMFRLSDEALRHHRLLNGVLRLRPTYRSGMPDAVQSGRIVRRSVHHGVPMPGVAGHAGRAVAGAFPVLRHLATKRSPTQPDIFGIDIMAEQAPTATSRVRLGRRRDRLGVPVTVLDWQLTSVDLDSIRTTVDIFGESVREAGVGEVISSVGSGRRPLAVFGNWHHLGTTRMHRDPTHGVVDENCLVHGMSNMYIAGGSVFPTGGYANPVLTIVALSLRLADHIKSVGT